MSRLMLVLTDALLRFLWQGAVVGFVTVSVLNALRSARASTRYAVLRMAPVAASRV